MRTLRRFESFRGQSVKRWIALNRFVSRRRLAGEVRDNLLHHFPGSVLQTQVREAAVLAECPGAGCTIFEYRQRSISADEMSDLAQDLLAGRTL
jgi:chromosome partitioning protein